LSEVAADRESFGNEPWPADRLGCGPIIE